MTTTNDGEQYVTWSITQCGVDVLLNDGKKYIVWSPHGRTPQEKVHNNQAAAEMAAKAMASRYPANSSSYARCSMVASTRSRRLVAGLRSLCSVEGCTYCGGRWHNTQYCPWRGRAAAVLAAGLVLAACAVPAAQPNQGPGTLMQEHVEDVMEQCAITVMETWPHADEWSSNQFYQNCLMMNGIVI